MLLSPKSQGMRSCNFWRLMFNKVTSRSYNYFLKLVEKWIPPTRSETTEIGKKTEGILGVNYQGIVEE
jgi:hypothetical protein